MPKRKVFKKDLTPIGRRGRIDKQVGKGATEQRNYPGERETLTGGSPFDRMSNTYPAQPPQPPAPGGTVGPRPTALMPPIGTGIPDEAA
jgi:hypothetical protein